jgi:hypothetical protein
VYGCSLIFGRTASLIKAISKKGKSKIKAFRINLFIIVYVVGLCLPVTVCALAMAGLDSAKALYRI